MLLQDLLMAKLLLKVRQLKLGRKQWMQYTNYESALAIYSQFIEHGRRKSLLPTMND